MRSLPSLALLTVAMVASSAFAAPFLVAHRGASGEAPENTLPSFALAWEQGADAIEGDFYLTRDGQIVCIHDADTKRTGGRKRKVAASTLAELRDLDVGSWKDKKFANTRIPTFAEVCATIPPGRKIFIEVKCGPEIVPALLAELAKSGLQDDQFVVIAFDADVIKAVKEARPQWIANWLYSFDKRKADAPAKDLPKVLQTLRTIKASALASSAHPGLTREHLTTLAEAGFPHHVWTINDAATARRFLDLGSRSITTDFPGRLRRELAGE